MREDTALQRLTLRSDVGANQNAADGRASTMSSQLDRMLGPDPSASERIGHLVRRAILFLESDLKVAWRCLNDASALLGAPAEASSACDVVTSSPFHPGGLARWQARLTVAHIEANLESKLEVHGLAELVSFSKSHFSRAFKRSLGLPPMAYVMLRRIERAKVLMTSTTQQLSEIALICGFADQSHLNRSFRRLIGVSPGRWRRTNAEAMGLAIGRQARAALKTRQVISAHPSA
jgi:AraC family transcriptional regulator